MHCETVQSVVAVSVFIAPKQAHTHTHTRQHMHNDVAGNYLMGVIVVLVMADWLQLSVVMTESMNRWQQLNTYTVAPMTCF